MAEAQNVEQESQDDSSSIIFSLPINADVFRVIENMDLRVPAVIPYINSLEACSISDLNEDDRTCYICNEDYAAVQSTELAEGQAWPIKLSCGHHFCSRCLANWLNSNNTCPMCRGVLFSALSDFSTITGIEERLGLLELYALQHDLSERDEGIRAELRIFLQRRREMAAAQDPRDFEGYREPGLED